MCWFKKKKKVVISNNKYTVGQMVNFKYRGDVSPGMIYRVKLDNEDHVIYDVQVGGECPAVMTNVKEEDIFLRR